MYWSLFCDCLLALVNFNSEKKGDGVAEQWLKGTEELSSRNKEKLRQVLNINVC